MLVEEPPLPLLLPPLPPAPLPALPPFVWLPPCPFVERPESFVQATRNAQPERRLTRIVDVLRIESSKNLLSLADASSVPSS